MRMTIKDTESNSGFHLACLYNQLGIVCYYQEQEREHQPRNGRGHGQSNQYDQLPL
jgi:hypothetical protein